MDFKSREIIERDALKLSDLLALSFVTGESVVNDRANEVIRQRYTWVASTGPMSHDA